MSAAQQQTMVLIKECIDLNCKYENIWFKTSNKTKVDKVMNIGHLFIGLYTNYERNNKLGIAYILDKYPSLATYCSLYEQSDKELIITNYKKILEAFKHMD